MGYQVHIPLLRLQQCQRHSAKLTITRLQSTVSTEPSESQATNPSQAGASCTAGPSTARSRDGQPSPPSVTRRHRERSNPGGVYVGRPDGPSTQGRPPSEHPEKLATPTGRASALTASALKQSKSRTVRSGSLGSARLTRVSGVEGQPVSPSLPARPSLAYQASTPRPITLGSLCTLSVLTLHVVGKAHFYQHVGSNVPGG